MSARTPTTGHRARSRARFADWPVWVTGLLCLLFGIGPAKAAPVSTAAFTYQGYLEANGAPANGLHDFVFTVYDAATNGTAVTADLPANDVLVDVGVFTVDLDFALVGSTNIFDGNERWLQIQVDDGSGPTVLPRQIVRPSPYAVHALSGGTGGSGFWQEQDGHIRNTNSGEVAIRRDPSAIEFGESLAVGGNVRVFPNPTSNSPMLELKNARFLDVPVGGRLTTFDEAGQLTGAFGSYNTTGGWLSLLNGDGTSTVRLRGAGDGHEQGEIAMYAASGARSLVMRADEGNGDSDLLMYAGSDVSIQLDAGAGATPRGYLGLHTASGLKVELNADDGAGSSVLRMKNATGQQTVTMNAGGPNGGVIQIRDDDSSQSVYLFGDYGDGKSRVVADVLQITGGSDLSERFDISPASTAVVPGLVVSIDPANPGRLKVSERAYDSRVAGVVSGAQGIAPGMLMSQGGTLADGEHPVALTGRVYAMADASFGAIEPGDLLTTSSTPGYAMKVTDVTRAHGAILGKAMTELKSGRGTVLVLVTLH